MNVNKALPLEIPSGSWKAGHVQGIAIDQARKYMYFSFTTALIKTDLKGHVIGTVTNLLGHLGCIAMGEDGRVYGSLEYKRDAIGQGIAERLGTELPEEDAFYIAVFEADRIVRQDMDAEKDGIMTCVYLKEVAEDFYAEVTSGGKRVKHRFGCSGIDGTAFGPRFGDASGGKTYLTVAYGIYGDNDRRDNDYQVLLQYDIAAWDSLRQPLHQHRLHHQGPETPNGKYFVYTGNTTWGVQNLEYDAYRNVWFMTVYQGKKPQFGNAPMFLIDQAAAPRVLPMKGLAPGITGRVLTLVGEDEHGLAPGYDFPWGQTGFIALGDGRYYVSENGEDEAGWNTTLRLYRWDETGEIPLIPCEKQ